MTKIVPTTPSNPAAFDMSEAISKAAKAPPVRQHTVNVTFDSAPLDQQIRDTLSAKAPLRDYQERMMREIMEGEMVTLRRDAFEQSWNGLHGPMRAPSQRPTRRDYADVRLSADELNMLCDAMNRQGPRSREHAELMNKLIVNLHEAMSR